MSKSGNGWGKPEPGLTNAEIAARVSALSETARGVYDFVLRFKAEHDGVSPTISEIMTARGINSSSVTLKHLEALEDLGLIYRLPGKAAGIMVEGGEWRMRSGASEPPYPEEGF